MDDFFSANAIDEFLRALRKGLWPDTAAIVAKAAACEAVRVWNRSRGDDYVVHRWDHTSDNLIDRVLFRVKSAIDKRD